MCASSSAGEISTPVSAAKYETPREVENVLKDKVEVDTQKKLKVKRRMRRDEMHADNTFGDDFETKVYEKSDRSKQAIADALDTHFLFKGLDPEDKEKFIGAMWPLPVKAGDVIIKQGDKEEVNTFYVLEKGAAEASIEGQGVVSWH